MKHPAPNRRAPGLVLMTPLLTSCVDPSQLPVSPMLLLAASWLIIGFLLIWHLVQRRKWAEEIDRRVQEAEQRAKEEVQRHLWDAEQKLRETEEQRAQEEAERQAREEAERRAREQAEAKARQEAEHRIREEAIQQAREEAERKVRAELELRARKESERQARKEAERQAREEAERKAREEAERRARKQAEAKARQEAERRAKQEAERRAREADHRRKQAEPAQKAQPAIKIKQAVPPTAPEGLKPPKKKAAPAVPPVSMAALRAPEALVDSGQAPINILLADDSHTMRQIFRMVLAGERCTLTTVPTGEEALGRARELKPDLVVLDLSMDDLSGYEVCAAMRSESALSEVPILLLHGGSSLYDEKRAHKVGATGEIAKPFYSNELLTKLKQHL